MSREELDLIWDILDNIMNDGYIHGQDLRKLSELGVPYRALHKDNPNQNFNEFLHKVYEWAYKQQ
jgi:hypothetical protein